MGAATSKCCSGQDDGKSNEVVTSGPKEGLPGVATIVREAEAINTAEPESSSPPAADPPAPKAVTAGSSEFKIVISKQPNSRLGIDVDLSAGGSLLVDQVNEGLVMDWNKANPEKAMQKGDQIVEVNGSRGNAQQLTEVCKRDEKLEMTVLRGVP
mmetsp:Transcript_88705/g.153490  ORF Transcript_88705/g.153490 Transcript_88705/m.153490 type:complete len:155 (-) Transcript_88705:99-563(-)